MTDSLTDYEILRRGVETARSNGLFLEFWDYYHRFRGMGDSVAEAVWCALYEWDV